MWHKDFRDSDKNVSSRNFMHLNAKKVYKRCLEKVKQPRKIQCNRDYNNTPLSYEAVQKWGVLCLLVSVVTIVLTVCNRLELNNKIRK